MSHADRMIAKAQAEGDQVEAEFWRQVKADVDQAPPLSAAVRDKLAIILRPAPAEAAPPATPRRAAA